MRDVPPDQRAEFYSWLLTLDVDARVVRYGCDQNFGREERKSRTMKPKTGKRGSYPAAFERWRFDYGEVWKNTPNPNQVGFEPKSRNPSAPFRPTTAEIKAYYETTDEDEDEKK